MSVYEFIARVIQHIDDVSINTKYYGYANRIRNRRNKEGKKVNLCSRNIKRREFTISWRELTLRVWEVDPLVCINCGSEIELKFLFDKVKAKFELRGLHKMKYYFYGRWSERAPPDLLKAA